MILEDSADAETAFFPSTLSGLVEFDGYYLESDPCLVCNNPEVPFCVSNTLSRTVFLALWFSFPKTGYYYLGVPLRLLPGTVDSCSPQLLP